MFQQPLKTTPSSYNTRFSNYRKPMQVPITKKTNKERSFLKRDHKQQYTDTNN
jgi:hypothetical protein